MKLTRTKVLNVTALVLGIICFCITASWLFYGNLWTRSLSMIGRSHPGHFLAFSIITAAFLVFGMIFIMVRLRIKPRSHLARFLYFMIITAGVMKIISGSFMGMDSTSHAIHNYTAIVFGAFAQITIWTLYAYAYMATKYRTALIFLFIYFLSSIIFLAFVETLRIIAGYQILKMMFSHGLLIWLIIDLCFLNRKNCLTCPSHARKSCISCHPHKEPCEVKDEPATPEELAPYISKEAKLTDNILIIHNPNSGKGKGIKHANKLVNQFNKKGIKVGLVYASQSLEGFYNFCKENSGNPNKFTLAIIIGGDGTLSPCVDAMITHNFVIPMYAFGKGTANDFPTHMRTNKSAHKACKIILNAQLMLVDTLLVTNESDNTTQYAINVACGGAFTNGVTHYSKSSKRRFGKLAYMAKAMKEAMNMKSQELKFTVDGVEHTHEVFLFLILNTPNAGSIKHIIDVAKPNDGKFNLMAFKNCGFCGKANIALNTLFRRPECCESIVHITGTEFKVEVIGEPTKNFTCTDIDGNCGGPYPLLVKVSDKKVPIVTNFN